MNYDLSVVIPARSEMFLSRTVENILKNKRGNTEIIVGCDGTWPDPPLQDHPDLTILYYSQSIGQRAITNQCVKLSKAKYIMKIDAHCVVDEGFDVKMMSEMKDDYTMIPVLYNLYGFDWVCPDGHKRYQSPSGPCKECGKPTTRDIIFKPRLSRRTEAWRFDTTLHFQYHGVRKKQVPAEDTLIETMSAQGSCFMLTRDKYLELNICDEEHGSWGQQGCEIACKTWLSGGRLVTNRKTWYSHLFRTQGLDFGFPYPQSGRQVEHARKYSRDLWLNNKWDKQIYPLSWLIEKFKPLTNGEKNGVPDWHEDRGLKMLQYIEKKGEEFYRIHSGVSVPQKPTVGILTFSDCSIDEHILTQCRKQLIKASEGLPIVSVTRLPVDLGKNIVLPLERTMLSLFEKIVRGLEELKTDIVYLCDDDCLYHPSHFKFIPPKKGVFYYDWNVWRVRLDDGYAIHYDANQSNMLCAWRETMLDDYTKRRDFVKKNGWTTRLGFEPGTQKRIDRIDIYTWDKWVSEFPSIDLRHGKNLTRSRWKPEDFRNGIRSCPNWMTSNEVKGWGTIKGRIKEVLSSV